jgi:tetratricopeptide (TPR) repeat protein
MLDELERARRQPRLLVGVALGLVALSAFAVAAYSTRRGKSEECPDPRGRIEAVWNSGVRTALETAFKGTKVRDSVTLFGALATDIDRSVATWRNVELATCKDTRAGKLKGVLPDARQACLDRWVTELRGTVKILGTVTDQRSLDLAADASRAMSPVAACTKDADLSRTLPLPPEKRAETKLLEDEILEMELARRGRQTAEFDKKLSALVERVRGLNYPPTLARALKARVAAFHDLEDYENERKTLEELAQVAAAAGDDWTSAWAWTELVQVDNINHLPEKARELLPVARAAIARASNPALLRARILQNEAGLIDDRGQGDRAIALLSEAEQIIRKEGANDQRFANTLQAITVALGAAQGSKGQYDESIATFRRAIETGTTLRGADHPSMAKLHSNLAESLRRASRFEEALAELEVARRITVDGVGEGVQLVKYDAGIAGALYGLKKFDESIAAYDRTLEMATRVLSTDDPLMFTIRGDRAVVLHELGRNEEAIAALDLVIAFYEKRAQAAPEISVDLCNRGLAKRDLRRYADAIADFERSIKIFDSPRTSKRHLVNALVGLGLTHLLAGTPRSAIPPLQRAVADETPGRSQHMQLVGRWLLGRARVEARSDAAKGMEEISAARAEFVDSNDTDTIEEIDGWLAKHRPVSRAHK